MEEKNNQILDINLATQEISVKQIEDQILTQYLGGRGLGVKLFTEMTPKGIDPLSEKNHLIFTVDPLITSNVPTNGSFSLVTKSPLPNTIFHSNFGGYWGPFFKMCGFDGLIISGKKIIYCISSRFLLNRN